MKTPADARKAEEEEAARKLQAEAKQKERLRTPAEEARKAEEEAARKQAEAEQKERLKTPAEEARKADEEGVRKLKQKN